jgi:GH18 family chitinase
VLLIPSLLNAQPSTPTVTRRDGEVLGADAPESEAMWDSINGRTTEQSLRSMDDRTQHDRTQPAEGSFLQRASSSCKLGATVFGWNPYWMGTAYENYDYSLLSDVCYFSYEVDPTTGGYTSIHSWRTTGLVDRAKAAGTRVHLCVTLFSDHARFFANATARLTLIDSLTALVKARNANGVNIDFEAVPASERASMAAFIVELARRFHKEIPGSRISIALPAVDWGNAFDVVAMRDDVDLFIIMGYDYHWRGSTNTGPVSPKNNGTLWSAYDVTRSINNYLGKGIPPGKLALGVPYYGYEWPTTDSTIGDSTLGAGTAVLYNTAHARAESYGRKWEAGSSVPWYSYRVDSLWRQGWYDDEESLGAKYDLVLMKRLAGIGIWALGYDDGRRELWDLIESRFTDCAAAACTGTFTDMGGSSGNYYNNERYTFTIAPAGAREVRISFMSFSVAGDTLQIYDGGDTTAALIGSWTQEKNPGTVTARSGALTLRFVSDSATVSWGWVARWSCEVGTQGVRTNTVSPSTLRLMARPNPATGTTTVEYRLNRTGMVSLTLVNAHGDQVATLYSGRAERGVHAFDINGRELALPAGSYFLRLVQDDESAVLRLILR